MSPPLTLLDAQNPDGGWPYRRGPSWTEPTVYSLLALLATGGPPDRIARGRSWLGRIRRPDGGWPPHPAVGQSTWVTALLVLFDAQWAGEPALNWLLQLTGRESGRIVRLREWMLGVDQEWPRSAPGWPYFPGTSSWVTPTALTVLALKKALKHRQDSRLRERIDAGRQCLLNRICGDGGWNHGAPRSLGQNAGSYPETTGVALLALHGVEPQKLARSLNTAERHLASCRSAEGASWLQLGLAAHGRTPDRPPDLVQRSVPDVALTILADAAAAGRNLLVSA